MAVKKSIIWSPEAENDYDTILSYLEYKWNDKVVNHFMKTTYQTISWIAANPNQFQLIFKKQKIRKCIITKQNTIYFTEKNNTIIILRIFDTRQNPKKLVQ